jgi:hypothetical protein
VKGLVIESRVLTNPDDLATVVAAGEGAELQVPSDVMPEKMRRPSVT